MKVRRTVTLAELPDDFPATNTRDEVDGRLRLSVRVARLATVAVVVACQSSAAQVKFYPGTTLLPGDPAASNSAAESLGTVTVRRRHAPGDEESPITVFSAKTPFAATGRVLYDGQLSQGVELLFDLDVANNGAYRDLAVSAPGTMGVEWWVTVTAEAANGCDPGLQVQEDESVAMVYDYDTNFG